MTLTCHLFGSQNDLRFKIFKTIYIYIFIHHSTFLDLVQLYLARAVHAVAPHGAVGVGVAVAAGRKVAAGAVHAEPPVAVKVTGAVAAGGEGAANAVDAVSLVIAVGGAEAIAALIRFRGRTCERAEVVLFI